MKQMWSENFRNTEPFFPCLLRKGADIDLLKPSLVGDYNLPNILAASYGR